MKVRVIKLYERYAEFETEEERQRVGQVFDALKFRGHYDGDNPDCDMYALNLGNEIWYMPAFCCEVVEEGTINPDAQEMQHTNFGKDILLVEDGSVDIDKLEADGFYVIVYRQGSTPPMRMK